MFTFTLGIMILKPRGELTRPDDCKAEIRPLLLITRTEVLWRFVAGRNSLIVWKLIHSLPTTSINDWSKGILIYVSGCVCFSILSRKSKRKYINFFNLDKLCDAKSKTPIKENLIYCVFLPDFFIDRFGYTLHYLHNKLSFFFVSCCSSGMLRRLIFLKTVHW